MMFFVFSFAPAHAMVNLMSLHDLVGSSDLIVIAKINSVHEMKINQEGFSNVSSRATIKKMIKGNIGKETRITIRSYGNITISPTLKESQYYVLFLEGRYSYKIVNGPQGAWLYHQDDQTFGGLGTGYTMEDLQRVVAENPPFPEPWNEYLDNIVTRPGRDGHAADLFRIQE